MPQTDETIKNEEEPKTKKEIHKDDDIDDEEKEPEKVHLKTKSVPAITTLVAGLVAALDTFYQGYPLKNALLIILFAMLVFWIIGEVIKILLDRIEIIIPDSKDEDESTEDNSEAEEEPADEEN